MKLEGKVAVVTGGTCGIGRAVGQALCEAGFLVALLSRGRKGIPMLPDRMAWVSWDATLPGTCKGALEGVEKYWGPVNVLVNNVGGGSRMPEEYAAMDHRHWWETVMRRNLGAMQEMTDLVAPGMAERGWGRVVTISSIYGREAGGRPWFAAAKAAEVAAMKAWSWNRDWVRHGVTFNVVAPGTMAILGTGCEPGSEKDAEWSAAVPMGRLGKPHEVAAVVAFLCSDAAAWVNGACWTVDGGEGGAF